MSKIPQLIAEKELRDNKRYKQVDIVEATNLSPSMVSRLVRGTVNLENVTLAVVIPMAQWLECNIEDLYSQKDKEN